MKFKFLIIILFCFVVVGLLTGSCKKTKQDYIATLFTGGHWQLSSLIVTTFVGDTTKTTDTLYATCALNQTFTFNADNTCSYANFACQDQTGTGKWSLSADRLFLNSTVAMKDSTNATVMPFSTARIDNLGQYSLVMETGDLETYYLPNQKRVIARYGFVRVKTQ